MTPNIWLKSQGKTVFAPLSNAAWTPATRTLGIPTTTTRYPGTRIKIVHRLSAVRAHFFRRKRSTCVLVAGPSELKIVDAKDQSAHHRKDAGRQRGLAQHAVYLQRERCYAGRGGHSIFPWRHSRQWWDTLYPNYTVRMASYIKQTKNVHPKYTKIFSKQCSK